MTDAPALPRVTAAQRRVLLHADTLIVDVPYGLWRAPAISPRRATCESVERLGLIEKHSRKPAGFYKVRLTDLGRAVLAQGDSHD